MQSKTTEHTPGPWTLCGDYVTDGNDKMVAATSASGAFVHKDEWVAMNASFMSGANARLIAAAPDLLEALETLAAYANGCLGKNPYGIPEFKTALVAIAKAKGLPVDGDKWMDANNEAYAARTAAE